jgi:2-C-methyl-D-erythritol 4-phosphate cytidylyltransferase
MAEGRSITLSLDWGGCQADVVAGGSTRQDSVRRALEVLHRDVSIVIVHDAARPLVAPEMISAVVDAAGRVGAATAATRPSDSMRIDTTDHRTKPVDRSRFWLVETPQAFQSDLIRRAHSLAAARGLSATDDASLVEQCDLGNVELVESRGHNLKVTTAEDLELAALILGRGSIVSA